uniref:Phospholipase A2 n=1 Tax=Strix occidentalis caurina TaxID=311401 RepID=A0A8D0F4T9_STROC
MGEHFTFWEKKNLAVVLSLDTLSLCLSSCYTVTLSDCYVTLWLPTASNEKVRTRTIRNSKNPVWNEAFCYKIDRRVKNVLELKVCDEDTVTRDDELCTVLFDIDKLTVGRTVRVKFQGWLRTAREVSCLEVRVDTGKLKQQSTSEIIASLTYWFCAVIHFSGDLDVRLGFNLCMEEQDFLQKRKKYVAAALKKILHLEEDLKEHEVPVVAITTTGGGTRSLTAMYGSLLGLQKLNLLDCISYIGGLSGTTWTMANLYEDANWSQKYLEDAIKEARKQVTKSKICCFSLDCLKYYYNDLMERTKEGHNTSFIDLWGLVIESMLHDKHRLSDQRQAVDNGQNPLPIYVAINLKSSYSAQAFREWLEFTPYEVGLLKYGASVRAEHFGSEFFMGRMVKRLSETRICYMQGMWSSIFSIDVMYVWNLATDSEDFWCRWTRDREGRKEKAVTYSCKSVLLVSQRQAGKIRGKILHSSLFNFLQRSSQSCFLFVVIRNVCVSDTVIDSFPNKLMETADNELSLVDTGFFINTSYPPLLRSKREVDVILFDSFEEDRENLKECYVFEDADSPQAPTVLFFPLVNDTFKKYKAPGVERSPEEMAEGKVDVSSILSPFTTREVCFSEDNFDKLVKLTDYNVLNNEKLIIEALRLAVARRKQRNY